MVFPLLSVNNISEGIQYYENVLRFSKQWSMDNKDGNPTFASVKLGENENLFGTIDFVVEGDRGRKGIGIQLYTELPEGEDTNLHYQNAVEMKAKISRSLEIREWGEKVYTLFDLDGYNLMFAQHSND